MVWKVVMISITMNKDHGNIAEMFVYKSHQKIMAAATGRFIIQKIFSGAYRGRISYD